MGKYLKLFNQDAEYQQFKETEEFVLPNVSFVESDNVVYYNPYAEVQENRLVCTYNVTDTTSATQVCDDTSYFTSMEVDGVLLDSVVSGYTFDVVGEHTVKFELADPTTIGEYAFNRCANLTLVVIPDSVTTIEYQAFFGCSSLTSIVIPDSVTYIGEEAFCACTGLTDVHIGSGVTEIGNYSFYNCQVTSINIPDSVTYIGEYAFMSCKNLTSVHIGSGVTNIGNEAFCDCSGLSEITCDAMTAPRMDNYTFQDVKQSGILKVPAGSDYSSWMSTNECYLGYYNWTIEYI
jgi:hypothetical protein